MSALNNTALNCISGIFTTDFYSIVLNTIRITVTLLYLTWAILLLIEKELRRKEMIFLNNLNAIGTLYCIIGLYYLFYSSCSTMSDFECTMQAFSTGYFTLLPNYGLMSLVFYRLYCGTIPHLKQQLKAYRIFICLAIVWLLPAVIFSLPLLFGLQLKSTYFSIYHLCIPQRTKNVFSFIYSVTTVLLVPNLSVASVYLYLYMKSKTRVSPVNTKKRFPRVTIQVIIYILIFEINCTTLFYSYYQAMNGVPLAPEFLQFMRIYQWFNNFSPLGLFYLHEAMLNKYKRLLNKFKIKADVTSLN